MTLQLDIVYRRMRAYPSSSVLKTLLTTIQKYPMISQSQWYKRHSTKKRGELELQVRLDIQEFVRVVDSKMQSVDEVQETVNKYHARKVISLFSALSR